MSNYVIKVFPGKGRDEEFPVDKKLMEGIDCDKYLILGFKDDEIVFESMMGISVEILKSYLLAKKDSASVIMQAAQIAEGYLRAIDTFNRSIEKKETLELFKNLILDALGDRKEAD